MYRKRVFFRFSAFLIVLGLVTLAGCDLNGDSTETFSDEEVIEMMAADLASEGGETATLNDISNSPPAIGSFTNPVTWNGTYVSGERHYDLTIAGDPATGEYTIDGEVTGQANRPRIDSSFTSDTDLTVTDWDGTGTITVNGTVHRTGTIDYESLVRDATRATQANVTYTYHDVVFQDDADPADAPATGGTLRAEGSFVHEADRALGTRRIEWSGTVVFEFSSDGTTTAHVEGSSASYTINLGAENDDDLVDG